jgi:3-dehydroquinate synthase
MVLAARISVNLGFLKPAEADRLEAMIASSGLPVTTDIGREELFDTLLKDKKRSGSEIHFILLRGIGEAFVYKMQLESLRTAINDLY